MIARPGGPLALLLLLFFCLPSLGAAAALELPRLELSPPAFAEAPSWAEAAPGRTALGVGDAAGPSRSELGWLAFGLDLALNLGTSGIETGLLGYGIALSQLGLASVGTGAILAVALILIFTPLFAALIADAIADLGPDYRPDLSLTLMAAYAGCLLGGTAFVVTLLVLHALPWVELLIGGALNALIPSGLTAFVAEATASKRPRPQEPFETGALAASPAFERANEPALALMGDHPLTLWAF